MNYLIEHAKNWVWCNPSMDRACNIKLQKITNAFGAIKTIYMPWFEKPLPDPVSVYHGFFIGHVPKFNLGMDCDMVSNRWYNLCDLMSDNFLILNVFLGSGIEVNKAIVYVLFTNTKGAILAIKESVHFDVNNANVYLRIYKNCYFSSIRKDKGLGVKCEALINYTNSQLVDFVNRHNELTMIEKGGALACVNGFWTQLLNTQFIEDSSIIESVYDQAIDGIYEYSIDSLESFLSNKDKKRKYLIHLPKKDTPCIYYFDDCDFYIGQSDNNQLMKAIRLSTIDVKNIRQITHGDYSISIDFVSLIIRNYFANSENIKLWVVTRKSGYQRPLWFVNDKIRALYKLSDSDIIEAMVNIDSTVSFWNSEHLENSAYPLLMAEQYDIIQSKVVDCYGYRGLVKALSDGLIKCNQNIDGIIQIPFNYQLKACAIEYDKNRYLSNIITMDNQQLYSVGNNGLIEFVKDDLDTNYYIRQSIAAHKHCFIIAIENDYNYYRVWLNNKALINTIDFKIIDNNLYIYNKEYLKEDNNIITVLADGRESIEYIVEIGYGINNMISINGIYDYYDDRLIKAIINGKVYAIDEIMRLENNEALTEIKNGSPYCLEQLNPTMDYPNIDFDTLKLEAIEKEKVIQNYLSLKIDQSIDIPFTTIAGYYCVYSIFLATIIYDLQTNDLYIPSNRVDDTQLDKLLIAYKPLLEFDIALENVDLQYIRIHPHPYNHTLYLSQPHYNIIERIITLYKLAISDLSPFLQIEN